MRAVCAEFGTGVVCTAACGLNIDGLTKQQCKPYSVYTEQFWNGRDYLFVWYTCMLAKNQSFLWCSLPIDGCLPVHPEGWWRGVCQDGLPVGCVSPFDTSNTWPPPPVIVITPLSQPLQHCKWPFLHQSQALRSQTLEHNFTTDKLQW